jgi:translocation and assembly module TamB
VALATLKLDLDGDWADQFLNIKQLSLPKVLVELPDIRRKDLQNLDRPKDIVIVRGGSGDLVTRARDLEKKKAKAKAKASSFSARAVINAQQRIQVKSSDVDIELGLSDGFHLEYANTVQLYGEATVKRGKLSVLGREFAVQQGSQARFAGPAAEPYVNVTAVYTNNTSNDKTKVTVSVVGRGTDISLKVSSEPPLSESEIYTLLATGRPALSRGGGSSVTPSQAASVIGSALAAQAKTAIAKNVPIDVLDFESGDNFTGVKVNVGKYLTDTIFVGYSLNPGADVSKGENPHTVRLEYQVTHNWSLEASAGTAPAADADVVWSRDF